MSECYPRPRVPESDARTKDDRFRSHVVTGIGAAGPGGPSVQPVYSASFAPVIYGAARPALVAAEALQQSKS